MLFLDIPKKDKKKLGAIINYYRTNIYKESYPNSWSMNSFIENNNHRICSITTLSSIENGEIIKNDDIYDELLKKLGQEYNYEKDLTSIHKTFGNKITSAFENYNNKLLDNLIKKYTEILNPYKNYIIEKEIIFALDLSRKALNTEMKDDINRCLKLFPIYSPGIQIILSNKLDSFAYNFGNPEEAEKIYKVINLSKSKSYRLRCHYAINLINEKYYFKATQLLLELQKHYSNKNNVLGLLKIYSVKLNLIDETGSNEWLEEIEKTLPIFKKYMDKDKDQIIIYFYNIAMGCLNRNEYSLASELLLFILDNSNQLFLPTAIYLNIISTLTGIDAPPEANKKDYDVEKYPEVFNTIYKFYLLKNAGSSPEELEKYIFEKIRPLFVHISDDSLYNTFQIELEECVKTTKNNHLIYNYNRIRRKSANF